MPRSKGSRPIFSACRSIPAGSCRVCDDPGWRQTNFQQVAPRGPILVGIGVLAIGCCQHILGVLISAIFSVSDEVGPSGGRFQARPRRKYAYLRFGHLRPINCLLHSGMEKWEYRILGKLTEVELNTMGIEGWELISIAFIERGSVYTHYFK